MLIAVYSSAYRKKTMSRPIYVNWSQHLLENKVACIIKRFTPPYVVVLSSVIYVRFLDFLKNRSFFKKGNFLHLQLTKKVSICDLSGQISRKPSFWSDEMTFVWDKIKVLQARKIISLRSRNNCVFVMISVKDEKPY